MKRSQHPTYTSLVTDALRSHDDFMSVSQLMSATQATRNQITAALHCLKQVKAIDCIESGGSLYWYLTPDTDQRIRVVKLTSDHTKKRPPGYIRGQPRKYGSY